MEHPAQHKADVLLVTVTDTETDAVYDVLNEHHARLQKNVFIGNIVYRDLGTIGGARTFLVRSEMGTSGLGSSLLTINASIQALRPDAIIMVGIAFGLKPDGQKIGDVLVSRQLMLYDLQRVGTDTTGAYQIRPRGDRPAAAPRLVNNFRAGRDTWRKVESHFGLILSGEKLVDNQDFCDQLRDIEPEAIGGDMEGAGLYVAAQDQKVDWIVVKAISDWANGKKHESKEANQQLAARNAAEFVFHVIEQGGLAQTTAVPSIAKDPGTGSTTGSTEYPAPTDSLRGLSGNELRLRLIDRVNKEEVRTICFDLGIDPDDLPGEEKSAKIRELIAYLERRNKRDHLHDWLSKNRPDIT